MRLKGVLVKYEKYSTLSKYPPSQVTSFTGAQHLEKINEISTKEYRVIMQTLTINKSKKFCKKKIIKIKIIVSVFSHLYFYFILITK